MPLNSVCVCGKTFLTDESLRKHQRYHCRPIGAEDNVCRLCERPFKSFAGMRQHFRRAHPLEYNESLQDEDRRVLRPWTAFEDLELVRAEIAYKGYNINQHLASLFPDRTLDSIKSHRRSNEYRLLRDRVRIELEEAVEDDRDADEAIIEELTPSPLLINADDPVDVDAGPEVFVAGPPSSSESSPASVSVIHVGSLIEYDVSGGDMPSPPPLDPSPPSSPAAEVASPDSDAVLDYIQHLRTLIVFDDALGVSIDRVCDLGLGLVERRVALSAVWNGVGLRMNNESTRTAPPLQRRHETFDNRRQRYAYAQRLYKSDKSRLAEGLISGTLFVNSAPTFTAEEAFEVYNNILGAESPPDNEPIDDHIEHQVELYTPILIDELRNVLHARQSNAKGLDGVRPSDLKSVQIEKIALLFNLVLFSNMIPDEWRANRTILIPKSGGDNADINTWRPLTISSAGLRIFNKILAARFSKLPINDEQRGFRTIDGTLANTLTLQAVIKECRESSKPFSVTSLDLKKAFDTVSHSSLVRALERFRVDPKIRDLIANCYDNSTTVIDVNGVKTNSISINRGVKQGDPLSPILFNMVLDEAIARLKKTGAGIIFNDCKIACLAYADDLLIFANDKRETQSSVRLLERTLRRRGMALNHRKCSNISYNLLPNRSKLYLATRESVVVEGGLIRQLNVDEMYRYLGINYGFMGAKETSIEALPNELDRVVRAPLKPFQKLSIIKEYLVPRYIYMLQNPAVTLRTLSSADRLIRLAVKKALHLPMQTTNAALYAPTRQGGLGILSFRSRIPGILLSRLESLAAERGDEVLITTCITSNFVSTLKDKLGVWCRSFGVTSAQVAAHWASKLETSALGGGLWQVGVSRAANGWIDRPPSYWTGEEYIKNILLRFNLLPTRGGLHNRSGDTACRAGCTRRETVCHVLQACPATHFERIRRHDNIVKKLASFARARGLVVEVEPRVRDARGALYKPDLLFKRNDEVLIADVAVNWEGPEVLAVSAGHKVARYTGPEFLAAMSTRYPDCIISVVPFVVGARGGWCPMNDRVVDFVGLTRSQIELIILSTLKGGWLIHSAFSSRVWAYDRRR